MRSLFLVPVVLLGTVSAQDRPLPDRDTLIAEVKSRLAPDESRQRGYMFLERRTEQKVDASGRTTEESVRVFEVYPGLPGQERYRRLIEENGQPVSADELARQDRERQDDVEAYSRKLASSDERARLDRAAERRRARYAAATDDIFRVYDIQVTGREPIEGHAAIVATLTPKEDAQPQTDEGRIMSHFKARAWISESDYELMRAEIEAIETLSFGFGIIARVHKGTVATYERSKVDEEVWLPERVTWTASARVLLLKSLRRRGTSEFSNYRKYTVDTSTTYKAPPG
jgi:hypothetical protein